MGNKRKPAFFLANRTHCLEMSYTERSAYNEATLARLTKKCNKLRNELVEHLVRMRVKYDVINNTYIRIFPDAEICDIRQFVVSFHPIYFNWPQIVSGRLRLNFMKIRDVQSSPTAFRLGRVGILEPTYGFDTLSLAKDLRDMRKEFIAKRKARNAQRKIVAKSSQLAQKFEANIPVDLVKKFGIYTRAGQLDPKKFELELTYTVTADEAKKILEGL